MQKADFHQTNDNKFLSVSSLRSITMRYNKRNSVMLLVLCLTIISKSDSFLTSNYFDTTNSSLIEKTNDNDVNIDTYIEFKWVATHDMITKISIKRRLDGINNVMFNEDDFPPGDANDKKKQSSNSGQNSFWELYGQLDDGKKSPIYTQQGGGSRSFLSKFRFIVVPIWWSDEDTSDPDKEIKNQVINDVMDYNKKYYERMSFGKFNYEQHIIIPQTVIPVSSQNPSFGDLDDACIQVIDERGYIKDVDYNGAVCLYNVAKNGPFSGHGGWGTVNSELAITNMSWRWGLTNDVARHEFGHNFGHPHHLTNGYKWRFGEEGVVGYDDYDMMSGGNHYDISDFALASKWYFGWVPDSSVINMQPQGSTSGCPKCVSEGTYKLYPFDGDDASKKLGVHIPITRRGNTLYSYWLSYRSNNGAEKGLSVHVSWFGSIGYGEFGAYYDSLNYDAHGDTESRIDSFVLPGTCYHISPSVKMLEIDPSAAIATQPIVCVTSLNIGKSITIDVSFSTSDTRTKGIFARTGSTHHNDLQKPRAMSKDHVLMECGTSKSLAVNSNANQLVHVDNTGVDGIITLTTSSSSATASAVAYIYDRYPTSPIVYSAPESYGAFKSLSIPSGTKSIEYRAVHNEAWILITANSAVTYDASCTVNECQVGQKKVGKKCKPCQSNDTDCVNCPGGLEFLITTCVLSETVKTITTSKEWRLWTPDYHTLRGWLWDIHDVKFYSNPDCTGIMFNDGTPIDSGNAGGGWSAANAFDSNNGSAWGGRSDENNLFWLGMKFNALKKVQCISILDGLDNGVSELRVQAWDSSTSTWHNVKIIKQYQSGQRNNISLKNISTPSPMAPPKDPTSAPTKSENHCNDKETCCYYPCDELTLSADHSQIDQKGNCGFGCTDGLVPDLNGVVHTQLYFLHDYYWADHNMYDYDDENGPMKIEGSDKNMFDRCFDQCFLGVTKRPTPAPTKQMPTPAPNSCFIECGKSQCAKDIPRFLFAGQSNMEGHTEEARQGLFQELVDTVTGKGSKADKLNEMEDYIMLASESTTGSSKAEAKGVYGLRKIIKKKNFIKKPYKKAVCSWTNPAWSTKLDCERRVTPTACGDNYGPELIFAHSFPKKKSSLKNKKLGIIKVAQGGTEIYKHWMKTNDGEEENFWQKLVDAIEASKGSIEAFVWFQGENDSFDNWNKNNYLDNLTTFIGDVRNEIYKSSSNFESPADVPVIIVELGNWIYLDVDQTVINAQRTFVKNTENTVLVKTGVHNNPNKRLSKFYHFNAASQLIIGERIAKAMAKLLNDA